MHLFKVIYNRDKNKTVYVLAEWFEEAIKTLKQSDDDAFDYMVSIEIMPEFSDKVIVQTD